MKVILMVLDSVGIGELPDAHLYGDVGSNTLLNIKRKRGSLNIPNLIGLGLSNIDGAGALSDTVIHQPLGSFCKLAEKSKGKDTTTGHWEIAGVITEKGFPTYPNGFPSEIIHAFEEATQKQVIGNCVASGTEIIDRLGDEHVETGNLIVYTSADSVFQIAAHEEVVPIEKLYEYCETARKILVGEHSVSRVIARPFTGKSGNYVRTSNRRDFSLEPPNKTMLDLLKESGIRVYAVGKIEDIFAGRGMTDAIHTIHNADGIDKTIQAMEEVEDGLIFTNLVDFDMLYGHRNDYEGYAGALEEFDQRLPEIMEKLSDQDILIITADHGCDPTTISTDHSREYIPLLIYGKRIQEGKNLHIRDSFADIGATILDCFQVKNDLAGKSFYSEVFND